ncbi:hypothetical protein WS98_18545 [Burkholderia territorii]|uniref:hypothetical protein n=1 Tax=Burkholderia territorii TaxID=1503055 RepID=UPI0007547DCB|nr:hypothetical protein [Burkholderia territorii]KVL34097.1 hypothetical protein WS98_18545 [Burkholderia territorii]KVL42403.1 hypothetical protein WS97_02260 [Burkholderia territorii]KVQ51950.1 hypothetical protein WT21_08935 [Burkholderia territorii]KVT89354.1 hypothetical protein WT25_05300 [Burkholderia territorii]KVZ99413.1 hypothetical protein WT36_27415 [Burkholderia territorii]
MEADGLVWIFAPDQIVDRSAIRLSLLALLFAPLLAACASVHRETETVGSAVQKTARDVESAGSISEGQIDYAGHRCGNPNFYVKTHPCLFPRR